MKIRKLKKKERFDAYMISAYCFHMRVEDPEAERPKQEAAKVEDWGAFADDGSLMARIINNSYEFYIDGTLVKAGGIGAVSTLPEYRDSGAVKEIFRALIPAAYKNGEVISTLFPFKHAFYRKAGYETVTYMNEYTFGPATLKDYRFDGKVIKWNAGDSLEDFLGVYNEFAPKYNFAATRDEKTMLEHVKAEKPLMDRKFSYVLKKGGKAIAYVIFTDIRHDPGAILKVEECAWVNRDGFNGILGFLARFEADYGEIKLALPRGIDLLRIIRSANAYGITKTTYQSFMVRVINAKKLLETIRKPVGCDFTVKVTDDLIEENNRTYRVKSDSVTESKRSKVDIELSVLALGQMATGAVNFDEALLKGDVTLNSNEDMLRSVFKEKNIFVGEHF
ncbi:MAG: GNAT family N-acetyltransferase [Lachnospiraceae bacterium]|nr:GNAT family N-acetyltransferase [Lachnospiraceae bacterium]